MSLVYTSDSLLLDVEISQLPTSYMSSIREEEERKGY